MFNEDESIEESVEIDADSEYYYSDPEEIVSEDELEREFEDFSNVGTDLVDEKSVALENEKSDFTKAIEDYEAEAKNEKYGWNLDGNTMKNGNGI